MVHTKIFIQMFCLITCVIKRSQSRKYDVEAECFKIYKEDLATVLQRLRRTTDYLKILQDSDAADRQYFQDAKNLITARILEKLDTKITQMFETKTAKFSGPNGNGNGKDKDKKLAICPTVGRRVWPQYLRSLDMDKSNMSVVEKLDHYEKLHSYLSLKKRNTMKDIGYEYAGNVIHTLIKSIGGGDDEDTATRSPDDPPATTHVAFHTITADTIETDAQTDARLH